MEKIGASRSAGREGLGRSRGGLSSKIIVTATDEDTVIAIDRVPGQVHEAPRLEPLLDATIVLVPNFDEEVGDKGFDGDAQRIACVDRSVAPNIPNKSNRIEPWPFDTEGYRERNKVERLFRKSKQFQRFATPYEKRESMFRCVINMVFGFLRLRKLTNLNTA